MVIEEIPDSSSPTVSGSAVVSSSMWLALFVVYGGIGAVLHAIFSGAQFDWSSAWTFVWLFGWPITLVIASVMLLCSLLVSIIIVVICWAFFGALAELRCEDDQRRFT